MAKNKEAERRAKEIRERAERKANQLYDAGEKARPGGDMRPEHRSARPTDAPKTLSDLGISKQEMSEWRKLNSISDEDFEEGVATDTLPEKIEKARPLDPDYERKQQRWAATRNLIDGVRLFDRDRPGAGAEMAAAYDPAVAASYGEKITPKRIRNAIAFLEEVALSYAGWCRVRLGNQPCAKRAARAACKSYEIAAPEIGGHGGPSRSRLR